MFLLSLEKRPCYFAVVGKKTMFLLSLDKRQCFCYRLKKRLSFLLLLENKTMFSTDSGKEDNVFYCCWIIAIKATRLPFPISYLYSLCFTCKVLANFCLQGIGDEGA